MEFVIHPIQEVNRMKKSARFLVGLAAVVSLVTAYSTGTRATEASSGSSSYIEVCSRGLVYVPPGTRYVTCHGKVMRVLGMVPLRDGENTLEKEGPDDCFCPKCCGSACAVIVACGSVLETETTVSDGRFTRRADASGGLCTVYLACGD
jgi:hypothetical protein